MPKREPPTEAAELHVEPPPRDLSLEGIITRSIGEFVRPTVLVPFRISFLYHTVKKHHRLELGVPFLSQGHWTQDERAREIGRRVLLRWPDPDYRAYHDPAYHDARVQAWRPFMGEFLPPETKYFVWNWIREYYSRRWYWMPAGAIVCENIE